MKKLILLLFIPLIVYGQTTNYRGKTKEQLMNIESGVTKILSKSYWDNNTGAILAALIARADTISYSLSDFSGMSSAVTDISTKNIVLELTKKDTITSNVTVPSNVTVIGKPNGVIHVSSGTLTINGEFYGGNFQSFTSTSDVKFNKNYVEYVMPEWWGANPDSSGDSKTMIQRCWTASTDTGSIPIKITGKYILNSRITCGNRKIKLFGNSKNTSWIIGGQDGINGMFESIGNNSEVRDITFYYPNTTDSYEIFTITSDSITIDNCKFICENVPMSISGSEYIRVTNCDFKNEAALHVGGNSRYLQVCNNTFISSKSNSTLACINFHPCDSSIVTNNIIEYVYHGVLLEVNSDYNIISNNTIRAIADTSISTTIGHGIYNQGGFSNTITGNKIVNFIDTGASTTNQSGIALDATSDSYYGGHLISNNTIDGYERGIYVQIKDLDTKTLLPNVISNNTIITNTLGVYITLTDASVAIDTSVFNIYGNLFSGQTSYIFYDNTAFETNFSNNTIIENTAAIPFKIPGSNNKVIRNNIILHSSASSLFDLTSFTGTLIQEHNIILPTRIKSLEIHNGFTLATNDSIAINSSNFIKKAYVSSDTLWYIVDTDTFYCPKKP